MSKVRISDDFKRDAVHQIIKRGYTPRGNGIYRLSLVCFYDRVSTMNFGFE